MGELVVEGIDSWRLFISSFFNSEGNGFFIDGEFW